MSVPEHDKLKVTSAFLATADKGIAKFVNVSFRKNPFYGVRQCFAGSRFCFFKIDHIPDFAEHRRNGDTSSYRRIAFSGFFCLARYKGVVVFALNFHRSKLTQTHSGIDNNAVFHYPVDATDYEVVDIFNWQEEAAGMISQMEFVRRVDVQSETIEKYVREGKIVPDLAVPMSEHRVFKYFKEETVEGYAEQFGWHLIDDKNRKDLFMKMVEEMDMSYSYKPVLLKAVFANTDKNGRIKIEDIVSYFKNYYEGRRAEGLIVEKSNSIFAKGGYTDKQAERNILANPFKRFEDMNMMRHTKTLGVVEVDSTVWKKLTLQDIASLLCFASSITINL